MKTNILEFFSVKRETFGLDISDLSLKIALLKETKKGTDLVSWGETKIPQGIIREGEIQDSGKLAKFIGKAVQNAQGEKLNTNYVVASLPEEKAYLQVIQMPKVAPEDLRSAVLYEAENYIPVPLEEVYLDFQLVEPKDHLDHYDILIAALPRKTIDPYVSSLKSAGLEPVALEIESLAIIRALIKNHQSSSPVLIIDFGATRSNFIIFSGRSLRFTSSISVSSDNFTNVIAKSLTTTPQRAEALKIKYGLTGKTKKDESKGGIGEERKIFEALIPALVDLTQQIKKHLDYYQTHSSHEHLNAKDGRVSGIILCGGGSNLKGFRELLETETKLPVEICNPWTNVGKESSNLPKEKALGYATALGLALRNIEKIQQQYD